MRREKVNDGMHVYNRGEFVAAESDGGDPFHCY